MSPEEAFGQYLEAMSLRDRTRAEKLDSLYRRLAANVDVMRLLHFVHLNLGPIVLRDHVNPEAHLEARARGWIEGSAPRLTQDGLNAWLDWVEEITPHTRLAPFQELWRVATGW
ncbi:hypothetical protein FKR81_32385 [Lentzea tibetensis]|uniref:Uncharacterized protein n=1 Tax=Lentzea tibetensis TaxID=2591470 RepID=A0A563EK40_9PSEU|nr:hypothetical protein [Lentzea tibetensis]TWP47414.1 hypothetical protein FKR81_32385 [Lentzea tibetensis]